MRNVIIPEANPSNCINLLEIDSDFSGILLGYKQDIFIGFIIKYDENWIFSTGIDLSNSYTESKPYLRDLIKEVKKGYGVTDFKVLEYGNQKRNFRGSST